MKIIMQGSETGRWPGGGTYHLRAGEELTVGHDVPHDLAAAWIIQGIARPDDSERNPTLPDGYAMNNEGGGYYMLWDAEGEVVPGPSNGKWQGADGAAQGAWTHYHQQEEE